MFRPLSFLLGVVALVALSPADLAAKKKKPRCPVKNEQVGCKLKTGLYRGNPRPNPSAYGATLTIDSPSSIVRGVVGVSCTGGPPLGPGQQPTRYAPFTGLPKLPKTVTIGKTYSKTAQIDRVENTGQVKVRLQVLESVKVKITSAKRARVELRVNQTTQNVDPPPTDPARTCAGSGVEIIKRAY